MQDFWRHQITYSVYDHHSIFPISIVWLSNILKKGVGLHQILPPLPPYSCLGGVIALLLIVLYVLF